VNGFPSGFAIQELLGGGAVSSEGTSYTLYSEQANAKVFDGTNNTTPISSRGILDPDQIDSTYKMCKLEAMKKT